MSQLQYLLAILIVFMCCTQTTSLTYRSFPTKIETGSFYVNTNPFFSNYYSTVFITFKTSKTNNLYLSALGYQTLVLDYFYDWGGFVDEGIYSIKIQVITKQTTRMNVRIYSGIQTKLQKLKIRFLIVQQIFQHINIVSVAYSLGTGYAMNSTTSIIIQKTITASNTSSKLMPSLTGWTIKSNPNYQFEITTTCSLINQTQLQITFSNSLANTNKPLGWSKKLTVVQGRTIVYQVTADIIIYDYYNLLTAQGGQFKYQMLNNSITTSDGKYTILQDHTINNQSVFFGIYSYKNYDNSGKSISFQFTFIDQQLKFKLFDNRQSSKIVYLLLEIPVNCSSPSVWISSNSTCITPVNCTALQTYIALNDSCQLKINCSANEIWISTDNTCFPCPISTYPNNDTCSDCMSKCQNCINTTYCLLCAQPYYYNTTNSNCSLNCSNISECTQCEANSNRLICINCTSTYVLLNETTCQLKANCSTQQYWMDTNNTCILCANGTFPNNTNFSCDSCLGNCSTCINATQCLACAAPYTLYSNGANCSLNCSVIENCLNCSINSTTIICDTCITDFVVNSSSIGKLCEPKANCSIDQLYITINNTCATCPTGTYANNSNASCDNCLQNCSTCTNKTQCTACNIPFTLNTTSQCFLNCTTISNCTTCTNNNNLIVCTVCSIGYQNNSLGLCQNICGDGVIINNDQQCDDNNSQSSDGCYKCKIQPFFNCSYPVNKSQCFLIQIVFEIKYLVKQQKSNSFVLQIKIVPSAPSIYQNQDWKNAFSLNGIAASIASIQYITSSASLELTVSYNQNIDKQLSLKFDISALSALSSSRLSHLTTQNITVNQLAQNNLALIYYDPSVYQLAAIVQILSMIASIISILQFAAGYFGAKLIALECAAVSQISALLLITIKEMTPTFNSLRPLSYSLGFYHFGSNYDFQPQNLPANIKAQRLTSSFVDNFNIALIVILTPLTVALILKILQKTLLKQKISYIDSWKFVSCQYTFYGLIFTSYAIFACLVIGIRFMSFNIGTIIGTGLTFVLSVFIIILCYVSNKKPLFFGQFKNRFQKANISEYFYNLAVAERGVTSIVIVLLVSIQFQAVIIALIILLQTIFIGVRKPYVLRGWIRPLINKCLTLTIILTFAIAKYLSPSNPLNIYAPFLILTLIFISQAYSCYFIFLQLKQKVDLVVVSQKYNKFTTDECNRMQMEQFQMKILPEQINRSVLGQNIRMQPKFYAQNWQNYAKLYRVNLMDTMREQIKKKMNQLQEEQREEDTSERNIKSTLKEQYDQI